MGSKISAVIITKNEVDRISDCLNSLHGLTDDIVVVDSGSTDQTVAIAKELGARVFQIGWNGYGANKNFGHSMAKYEWILSLDADEKVSENLKEEIRNLPMVNGNVYSVNRQNFYLGKAINHSGWSPDWVHRIFNKTEVKWNDKLVHEKLIIPEGIQVHKLQNRLLHHSYRSIDDHKSRIEKYAALRAKMWFEQDNEPNLLKRWIGPFLKGFKSYILKLGFLDGNAGWIIAKMNVLLVKRQIHYFDLLKSERS